MFKKYTFWLKVAFILQLLTAGIHALSFINNPVPENETEKQLFDLMTNYKKDFGAGFTPSTHDFMIALSSCFTLLCLLGGLTNWYLLKKKTDVSILKGIVGINIIVFGICFGIDVVFTFLPPIICTGLIFISLLITWLTFPKTQS